MHIFYKLFFISRYRDAMVREDSIFENFGLTLTSFNHLMGFSSGNQSLKSFS